MKRALLTFVLNASALHSVGCLFRPSQHIEILFLSRCFLVVHLTAFWEPLLTRALYLPQLHRTISPRKQFEYFRKKEDAIKKNCGSHESKVLETSLMFFIFYLQNLRLNVNNHSGYILSREITYLSRY